MRIFINLRHKIGHSLFMLRVLLLCFLCLRHALSYRVMSGEKTILSFRNWKRHNMFSGIVEDVGVVDEVFPERMVKMWDGSIAAGLEMSIKSKITHRETEIGCSIAVNGVCLTATQFKDDKFYVAISPETIRRSNLGNLKKGSPVNIERALKSSDRNSGHFVQGHVDSTAAILEKWSEGDSLWVKLGVDDEYMKYIVPKGFISVDGASLTICDVNISPENSWFTVMLVPHTQQHIIFPLKLPGDNVNIEVDILGKFVERSFSNQLNLLQSEMEELRALHTTNEAKLALLIEEIRSLKNLSEERNIN